MTTSSTLNTPTSPNNRPGVRKRAFAFTLDSVSSLPHNFYFPRRRMQKPRHAVPRAVWFICSSKALNPETIVCIARIHYIGRTLPSLKETTKQCYCKQGKHKRYVPSCHI